MNLEFDKNFSKMLKDVQDNLIDELNELNLVKETDFALELFADQIDAMMRKHEKRWFCWYKKFVTRTKNDMLDEILSDSVDHFQLYLKYDKPKNDLKKQITTINSIISLLNEGITISIHQSDIVYLPIIKHLGFKFT